MMWRALRRARAARGRGFASAAVVAIGILGMAASAQAEPPPPTFSWTAPVSPSSKTALKVAGSAAKETTVKIYANATCTGSPLATGTAAAFASPGLATSVTANSTTTYHATATDSLGHISSCSSSTKSYVNDAKEILFEGSALSDFMLLQQCVPGRITEVLDPLGSGKTVMSFAPHSTDVMENEECGPKAAPTENPRANALSPNFIEPGEEFWVRARLMIPASFSEFEGGGWMTLMEIYGDPSEGPSPWKTEVRPIEEGGTFYGDFFYHQRNATYEYDIPWFEELHAGSWVEILLHEKFATEGFIEEWFNGAQEHFFGAETLWNPLGEPEATKLNMETRDSSNDGEANSIRIGQYRREESFVPSPTYFEFVKAGMTKASVGG
jgi:hypothetical protein